MNRTTRILAALALALSLAAAPAAATAAPARPAPASAPTASAEPTAAKHTWRLDGVAHVEGHDAVFFFDWASKGNRYTAVKLRRFQLDVPTGARKVVVRVYPKGTAHKGFTAATAQCISDKPCAFYGVDMPLGDGGKKRTYTKAAATRIYIYPSDGADRVVKTRKFSAGYCTD